MRSTLARVGVSVTTLGISLLIIPGILLGVVLGALSFAPPAVATGDDAVESAVSVEQIAAQLRRDPVFVQQVAGGGDVAKTRALIRETIAGLPYPVYVIAGRLPTDALGLEGAKTFAFALRRILKQDAVFAIAPLRGGEIVLPLGEGLPEEPRNYEDGARLEQAMYRLFRQDFAKWEGRGEEWSSARPTPVADVLVGLAGLGGKRMSAAQVEALASQRFLHVVTADVDDHAPESSVGRSWMRGTTVGILVAIWLPVLLMFLMRERESGAATRRRPRVKAVDPTDWTVEDDELERRRTALSRALAGLDPERILRRNLYDKALAAKEAADTCADSTSARDRLGALTLVEHGLRAARRARDKRPYDPWRPCFMNPRHGRATMERQWVFGDAEVRVPLCGACARRLDRSAPAQPLLVRDGRRVRPYFEVDDLWGRTGYGSLIDDYPATVLRERAR